jgi:hypothetical protein
MATLLFHARLLFDRTTILVCVCKHDGANTSCVRFSSSSTRWWSPSHRAPQNSVEHSRICVVDVQCHHGGTKESLSRSHAAINDSPPIATAATATREKETIFRILSFLCLPLCLVLVCRG